MDYNLLGPGLAAMFQGQQAEQKVAGEDIRQKGLLQDQLFAAQKQPLSLEQMALANQGTGLQNQTHAQNLGDLVETQDTRRAALNSGNRQKVTDNERKNAENFLDSFKKNVPLLQGIQSPLERQMLIAQMASDNGLSHDHTVVRSILGVPPESLQDFSDKLAQAMPKNREVELKSEADQRRQLALEAERGRNQRAVMQQQIDAGRFQRDAAGVRITFENAFNKANGAKNKHAVALSAVADAQSRGDQEALQYWSAQAQQLYAQAQAELSAATKQSPDLGQLGLPTAPPAQFGVQQPQRQAPQGLTPDLVQKSFGAYDPNTYEYRIGPNGNVQRRKKQ